VVKCKDERERMVVILQELPQAATLDPDFRHSWCNNAICSSLCHMKREYRSGWGRKSNKEVDPESFEHVCRPATPSNSVSSTGSPGCVAARMMAGFHIPRTPGYISIRLTALEDPGGVSLSG
jgi:hypothetical protein